MLQYRTYSFKLAKKFEKSSNILKYLPFFNKGRTGTSYRAEYNFQQEKGTVELVQEDKTAWHLAGHSDSRHPSNIDFILSSFFYLLGE